MTPAIVLVLAGAAMYWWYGHHVRRLTVRRLDMLIDTVQEMASREPVARRTIRAFPPRHRFLPAGTGVALGFVLWLVVGFRLEIAAAVGILIGVLTHLIEDYVSGERIASIEAQLAAAIYLMVGSLRAGASLLAAFESALEEIGPPLRPYFQEVAGRIRLGDDPQSAVADLQQHVPVETFRLFATSLAVHWEVGGSLATTLSTVGQTVRDRIELSRRVRAQGVEAHASTAVVLGIAYILGFLMWRTNPDRLEAFVRSDIGTLVVAAVIVLQAIGLIWMARMSRSTF